MALVYSIILTVSAGLAWWLSGYDGAVTGEYKVADIQRRASRCGATLLLVLAGLAGVSMGGRFGGFVLIALILPLAIIWTGCVSEIFARGFHLLIDTPDLGEFDPKELTRELDRLAELVQQGRADEAIELCTKLKKSGSGSALALETALFRVYEEMFAGNAFNSASMVETQRLYEEGHLLVVEFRLKEVLKQEPRNLRAGMMLMRLYARNLRKANRALSVLSEFEGRGGVPPGFVDYARQRINEWLNPDSQRKKPAEGIESMLVDQKALSPRVDAPVEPTPIVPEQIELAEEEVDPDLSSIPQLLTAGHLGTAIDKLERHLKMRPHDFDLRLQLAEAHGRYCCNLSRAAQIVANIETDGSFSSAQVQQAKQKLQEWRERQPNAAL